MKRSVVFGFVAVFLFSATGCGGGGAEGLIKDSISDMNALADAIEKKESKDKIKAIAERLKATGEKMKNMKLSKDEDERLKKKYEEDMKKALGRLMAAAMKAGPELGDLGDILK